MSLKSLVFLHSSDSKDRDQVACSSSPLLKGYGGCMGIKSGERETIITVVLR